jgi:hypothetical protein
MTKEKTLQFESDKFLITACVSLYWRKEYLHINPSTLRADTSSQFVYLLSSKNDSYYYRFHP